MMHRLANPKLCQSVRTQNSSSNLIKIKYILRTCIQFLESIQFLSFPFVYSFLNNQIFPSHRVLLEKLTVSQIFKPVTCSYPELDKDKTRLSYPHYLKLILLSTPFTSRSSKSLIPSGFPNKHLYVCLFFQCMLQSPLILPHCCLAVRTIQLFI